MKAYQEQCEAEWERVYREQQKKIDSEAEQLGIKGLYCLLKEHEELLNRHKQVIELLAQGRTNDAIRVLQGNSVE